MEALTITKSAFEYSYPTGNLRRERAMDPGVPHGSGGELFEAILDTVNPLQQLPVISSLYRNETGDAISALARLAGGFLFGGPIGLGIAAANAGLEAVTGKDAGGHVLAALGSTTNLLA